MPRDLTEPRTYGNSGNRWWVGMNIGETGGQRTIFGTPSLNVLRPGGYESLPSGNAADDAQFAKAAKVNKGSRKPETISIENIKWFNIQGPFTSQAAADKAIPAIQKANPAPGVLGQIAKDNNGNPVGAAAKAAEAAGSAVSSMEGFFSSLGDVNLWIRVAKVAVGSIILIVGLVKLTGADQRAPGIVKKAVTVAPFL